MCYKNNNDLLFNIKEEYQYPYYNTDNKQNRKYLIDYENTSNTN